MKSNFILFILVVILLNGCHKMTNETESSTLYPSTKTAKAMADSLALVDIGYNTVGPMVTNVNGLRLKDGTFLGGDSYTDWSGKITFKTNVLTSLSHQHNVDQTVKVDDGYVCVGGGCTVLDNGGYGAYIYKSAPLLDFSGWVASSKDHLRANSHILITYAIGMKIEGVSSEVLKSYMKIVSDISTVSHAPSMRITASQNYSIIGGGAQIDYNGVGILLTSCISEPYNTIDPRAWIASGKDQNSSDTGTITAFLIEIRRDSIPGFGEIRTRYLQSFSGTVNNGIATAQISNTSGYGMTCPGGISFYNGNGRLLSSLGTSTTVTPFASVTSKDHITKDGGSVQACLIQVSKMP